MTKHPHCPTNLTVDTTTIYVILLCRHDIIIYFLSLGVTDRQATQNSSNQFDYIRPAFRPAGYNLRSVCLREGVSASLVELIFHCILSWANQPCL